MKFMLLAPILEPFKKIVFYLHSIRIFVKFIMILDTLLYLPSLLSSSNFCPVVPIFVQQFPSMSSSVVPIFLIVVPIYVQQFLSMFSSSQLCLVVPVYVKQFPSLPDSFRHVQQLPCIARPVMDPGPGPLDAEGRLTYSMDP